MAVSNNPQHLDWLYQNLKKTLPLAFFILDKNLDVVDFNQKIQELLGLDQKTIGHAFLKATLKNLDLKDQIIRVIKEGVPMEHYENKVFHVSGEEIPVYIYAYPLRQKNLLVGAIVFLQDIRELKKYEARKKQFISMLAHDFKAPLSTALGFLKRLAEGKAGPLNDKQKRYIQTATTELKKLEGLIFNFLDMLRLESGHLRLELAPCVPQQLVSQVVKRFGLAAEKKNIDLHLELYPEEIWFTADSLQIERALANLIDNAIKYSPKDSRISVCMDFKDETIIFEVRDQGPGIPPADVPHIFEPFYRVKTQRHTPSGSGLGLAIVKTIVEAHGGQIQLETSPGEGTKFKLLFPRLCKISTNK